MPKHRHVHLCKMHMFIFVGKHFECKYTMPGRRMHLYTGKLPLQVLSDNSMEIRA